MKRCILCYTRESEDKETKDKLLFLTLACLPSKMKDGGLWYPKKTDTLVTACINATKSPKDYQDFKMINPGALIDITYGFNEFNNSTFIAKVDLVPGTNIYKPEILYK